MNPHEKTIQDIWLDFQKIRHAGCSHRSAKVNFTKLLVCWKHLWKISDWMGEQFWVGLICEGHCQWCFRSIYTKIHRHLFFLKVGWDHLSIFIRKHSKQILTSSQTIVFHSFGTSSPDSNCAPEFKKEWCQKKMTSWRTEGQTQD